MQIIKIMQIKKCILENINQILQNKTSSKEGSRPRTLEGTQFLMAKSCRSENLRSTLRSILIDNEEAKAYVQEQAGFFSNKGERERDRSNNYNNNPKGNNTPKGGKGGYNNNNNYNNNNKNNNRNNNNKNNNNGKGKGGINWQGF